MPRKGDKVSVLYDQDGATNMIGTVRRVLINDGYCVDLPCGGFRHFYGKNLRFIMTPEIETKYEQSWRYETDEFRGTCIIANDEMTIKFVFEGEGAKFYDVLKIDELIDAGLQVPVSVEGMADLLADALPKLTVTALGRAASHGWITATVKSR